VANVSCGSNGDIDLLKVSPITCIRAEQLSGQRMAQTMYASVAPGRFSDTKKRICSTRSGFLPTTFEFARGLTGLKADGEALRRLVCHAFAGKSDPCLKILPQGDGDVRTRLNAKDPVCYCDPRRRKFFHAAVIAREDKSLRALART
jgi:hypothetical protein